MAKDIGKVIQIKGLSRTDPKGEGGGRPYLQNRETAWSDHDKLVNDCYSELIAVAKDIGKVIQIKGLTDPKGEGGGRPYL